MIYFMKGDILRSAIFGVFVIGALLIGYMYVNDQKYIAFSECYQNYEKNVSYDNTSTPGNTVDLPISM